MVEFRRKKPEGDDSNLCLVKGCQNPVKRSMSGRAVSKALPDMKFKVKDPRRVRLCKEHYKEFKKATRDERKYERMGWEK
jgi:hypothetical protein